MALRVCLRRLSRLPRDSSRLPALASARSYSIFVQRDPKAGIDQNEFTGVEVTKNPEEWKHVERLLPALTVPPPPEHKSFPTPSGWIPPKPEGVTHPYFVERTRYHNLPVYTEQSDGGSRKLTLICRVKGDHWKFEKDLRMFIEKKKGDGRKAYTQVDECREKVRLRGFEVELVVEFLLSKGF